MIRILAGVEEVCTARCDPSGKEVQCNRPIASAVLAIAIVGLIILIPQRPGSHHGRVDAKNVASKQRLQHGTPRSAVKPRRPGIDLPDRLFCCRPSSIDVERVSRRPRMAQLVQALRR
jgi:hypothetical protein